MGHPKPFVLRAMCEQFNPNSGLPWPDGVYRDGGVYYCHSRRAGRYAVYPGDWICVSTDGERYPVHASVFKETYEPAPT